MFEIWDPQSQTTTGQLSVDANGRVDVIKVAGTTQTARDLGQGIPNAVAGAAGGIAIVGSNMGTTSSLTGDAFARLGAPAGASVSADVLQVKNYVDDIGVAGAGLTAIPTIATVTNLTNAPTNGDLTSAMKASVNAEADTALADYDAPTHTELTAEFATADDAVLAQIALVKAKTDLIPAAPAAVGDIPTAVQNADALLGRNVAGGSSAGRLIKDALRFLRNKWTVTAGTLTVYEEDDTTIAWTSTVTDDGSGGVIGSDPS